VSNRSNPNLGVIARLALTSNLILRSLQARSCAAAGVSKDAARDVAPVLAALKIAANERLFLRASPPFEHAFGRNRISDVW
jgi:hypothetical protein